MAAADLLATLDPRSAFPESGGNPAAGISANTVAKGLGFNSLQTSGACWLARLPATAALATGLTFAFIFADDVNNTSAGLVGDFEVSVKTLTAGTSTLEPTGFGTATTFTVTIPATAGAVATASAAILTANLQSAAAGSWVLFRLRRLGTAGADTHRGRIVCLGGTVRDT